MTIQPERVSLSSDNDYLISKIIAILWHSDYPTRESIAVLW